ncbi:MAG: glycerophosphodiester phosphodiesterase [Firmicutes bacterium]|nr:glycerophosphodiester phosphodiesterase [Bacillota bacterium]
MIKELLAQKKVTVAGHRGYKAKFPENTILSFAEAIKLGVDMLEIDLNMTRDKEIIIIHDTTLDRTTNGSGPVRNYTLAEIKKLDAGSWFEGRFKNLTVPTLLELIQLLQDDAQMLLNVEIKDRTEEMADAAVKLLAKEGLIERCVFTCFDAAILGYISDKYSLKTQGFPGHKMDNFIPGENGTYGKMWAVGIEMSLLTPRLVQEFQERNILAWSYCPDTDAEVMHSLDCGATLMTCNDPRPALRILRKKGLRRLTESSEFIKEI